MVEAIKRRLDGVGLLNASRDFVYKTFKHDKDIVLEAVKQSWKALQYASEDLKNDPDFVLEAVKQSWKALEYASEDLQKYHEITQKAIDPKPRCNKRIAIEK
jgi:hypothetical protein